MPCVSSHLPVPFQGLDSTWSRWCPKWQLGVRVYVRGVVQPVMPLQIEEPPQQVSGRTAQKEYVI